MRKFLIDCTGSFRLVIDAQTKEEAEEIAKYDYVNDGIKIDDFEVHTVWEEETEEITEGGT